MAALSKVLRSIDGGMAFVCPGCDCVHAIPVGEGGWTWDGNADAPTFSPSILIRYPHWVPPASAENPNPGPQTQVNEICHSFVRAGQIQFLSDCTHGLVGQTVPLPGWDD